MKLLLTNALVHTGTGADKLHFAYDSQRMYPEGINVSISGDGAAGVTATVDEDKKLITLDITDEAKGKDFDVTVSPK